MAFCSNCGKELEFGTRFCPACGTAASVAAEPAAAPTAPPVMEEPRVSYMPAQAATDTMVDEAFSKGLAATICAAFPVASIVAIVQGNKSLQKLAEAKQFADQNGISLKGKSIAARILGMIGKIAGIVMTVFYPLYIILIIALSTM